MKDLLSHLQPWHLYFAIGIVLLAIEMLTSTFDLLWLGLGALAGAVVAWLVPDTVWPALLTASVTALALTWAGRRWVRKLQGSPGFTDPVHRVVQQQGEVVSSILPGQLGLVKIGNETWSASAPYRIDPGEQVQVMSRSSTVLHVERAALVSRPHSQVHQ